MDFSKIIEPRKKIKRNVLIQAEGPKFSLEKINAFKMFSSLSEQMGRLEEGGNSLMNFKLLSEEYINLVHAKYGEEGLFKLQYLAMAHQHNEFKHFLESIKAEVLYQKLSGHTESVELSPDNSKLPANEKLSNFNIYFAQPSLSRKIYNPGRHHGYFSYGFGGPRILVSHPFKGINPEIETYDIYRNSIDLLTSILLRGYHGTFLFLDYLPGLNYTEKGIPAWLHWFSVIAIHSDLVLFVKDPDQEFGESQKLETEFTPDFIQKKIIEIPFKDLKWAKKADTEGVKEIMYLSDKGIVSQEEWYGIEAKHAKPFIDSYVEGTFPKDRYIKMHEDSRIEEFPLNYPIYR